MTSTDNLVRDAATSEDIYQHLKQCDVEFMQSLSRRTNLDDYCTKLASVGRTSEIWNGKSLTALCAYYINRPETATGFISNVSVATSNLGQGLGRAVVLDALERMALQGFQACDLEVASDNTAAISLYRSLGFQPKNHAGATPLILRKDL